MADPWNFAGPVTQLGLRSGCGDPGRRVDLRHQRERRRHVHRAARGALLPGHPDPVALRGPDQRGPAQSLAAVTDDPFTATFVSRCPPAAGRADSTLMVFRSRYVGQGMREDLTIRNFADEPAFCTIEIFVGCRLRRPVRGEGGPGRRRTDNGEMTTKVLPGRPTSGSRRTAAQVVGRRESDQPSPSTVPSITYTYRRGSVIRGVDIRFDPPAMVCRRPGHLRGDRARPGRVDDVHRGRADHRRDPVRPQLPVWPTGRPGHPERAVGPMAPAGAPGRDRLSRPEGGDHPEQRGPRAPCGSSTPTIPSGWWWRPAPPGS